MIVSGQFALIGVQDATVFEFCYKATSNSGRPATPTSADTDGSLPSGWLREPPDVSAVNAYVWESQRSKTEGLSWGKWSTPVLKNRWANDGAKGARMRIRDWAVGLVCLQGKEGEDFYDIVVYQTKLYLCTKSHTASNANNPVASVSGNLGYWEIAQDWVFVATRLLLAEKIKADQIDADGLTAKNVDITGKITATSGSFTGSVYASEGKIGGLAISGNSLTNEGFDNDAMIVMRHDAKNIFTGIGVNVWPSTGASTTALCRLENKQSRGDGYSNVCLYAEASGANEKDDMISSGNHAIYIPKGNISGFRLRTRRINASMTLSLMDSVILCVNTDTIYVTLPSGAENGQMYFIRKCNAGNIILRGRILRDFGSIVSEIQLVNRTLCIVIYDKVNSRWTTNNIQAGWD